MLIQILSQVRKKLQDDLLIIKKCLNDLKRFKEIGIVKAKFPVDDTTYSRQDIDKALGELKEDSKWTDDQKGWKFVRGVIFLQSESSANYVDAICLLKLLYPL